MAQVAFLLGQQEGLRSSFFGCVLEVNVMTPPLVRARPPGPSNAPHQALVARAHLYSYPMAPVRGVISSRRKNCNLKKGVF